jgi:hypothetical protein
MREVAMSDNLDNSKPKPNLNQSFAGIPIHVDPYMPKDELWLVEGKSTTVHVHEGPQAGEDIVVWLRQPRICRIVNLGDWLEFSKVPPPEIKL